MKKLTLLRHAKSAWDDLVPRDFDRPLNAKGRRAARAVGQHMAVLGLSFDHVVASPAQRVRETLEEVAAGLGQPLDPVWERRLYLAPVSAILEVVREVPERVERLLLVGHNPGLEQTVLALVPERAEDQARDQVEEKYPTASVAELMLPIDGWGALAQNGATLSRFIRPRDLDPTLGPDSLV